MNCNEVRRLLEADADGELDLVRHLDVQAHVRSCASCAAVAEAVRVRRTALKTTLPRFAAPTGLAEAVRASLPTGSAVATQARSSSSVSTSRAPASMARIIPFWQVTSLAASVAITLVAGYSWGNNRATRDRFLDEAIADHVRSLQVDHLTDVTSTNQHTVKPWFAGKLDFSPPVVDLASAGFPLAGGRLEHLANGTAAALVFQRRQHVINVFVWPASRGAGLSRPQQREGFNLETWTQGDLRFLAISEIPAEELAQFSAEFRKATSGS
jgi:anti-sigma factor RsiW